MAGTFVIKRSGDQFMFNLKAGNHENILASERYVAKQSAQSGITSVQRNAAVDERYRRLTAKNGQFYFTLTAANGETIGTSEMYPAAAARDKGIESVKTSAPGAPTKDET